MERTSRKNTRRFFNLSNCCRWRSRWLINLFQTYINAGFNTIAKIFDSNRAFPVYGDPGKGKLYTDLVSKFTAIAPDKVLTLEDVKKVGKAIARVEGGANWVSNEDFDLGFQMAKSYLKI